MGAVRKQVRQERERELMWLTKKDGERETCGTIAQEQALVLLASLSGVVNEMIFVVYASFRCETHCHPERCSVRV